MTGDFLQTWGPFILSGVTAVAGGGFLKVIADRTTRRAAAALSTAQAGKQTVEGEVAQSSDDRAWVTQAREDVRAAQESARTDVAAAKAEVERYKTIADDCRAASWSAQDAAAECRIEAVALRERVEQLETAMRDCPRAGCPLRGFAPVAGEKEE